MSKQQDLINVEPEQKEVISMQSKIMELALSPAFDPGKLQALINMQNQLETVQANKDLNIALANFQAECPIIPKTKKTHNATYAPFDQLVHIIKPILARNGLSYFFDTKGIDETTNLLITTIRHVSGAKYESNYYYINVDSGGKMNDSQRTKSALTYAKRAGIESALGLAVQDEDDDAERSLGVMSTDEQIKEIKSIMLNTNTEEGQFLKFLKVDSLEDLTEKEADKGIKALRMKRSK